MKQPLEKTLLLHALLAQCRRAAGEIYCSAVVGIHQAEIFELAPLIKIGDTWNGVAKDQLGDCGSPDVKRQAIQQLDQPLAEIGIEDQAARIIAEALLIRLVWFGPAAAQLGLPKEFMAPAGDAFREILIGL